CARGRWGGATNCCYFDYW
nr:immunoglobulin heavy chain junction region [Macaca mulatta]MOX15541.1 immunoglobulin heavy chain junction region [Macaca mulatta]MOX15940.1 immunoglobulin heavy chain junction region [Macaca mulatta]MOX15988.1 immunoglobulin heavy chain junction region [Macaca mulatta]